ncbi:MAG: uroporphyrinogen decarboxylase family protein [Rectinemataceae bacterium]
MNGYEKTSRSLSHRSGPVPVDFGSNAVTGMHVTIVEALRKHYGLENRRVRVGEPYQMLGEIEEDLKLAIGVDVEGVYPESTIFGFKSEGWKEWRAPWGQDLLVPEAFRTMTKGGATFIYPEGDTKAEPSAKLPEGGFFFDTIIRQGPLDEDHLDPEDNLQEFGPIGESTLEYFKKASAAARRTGRYVIANFGGTGLGDIALVTGPMIPHPRGIRDVAEWYMATVAHRDYVEAIFDRQTLIAVENLKRIREAVADNVDAAFVCGTDFGTQTSQFCSVASFESLWAPYYRRVNDWIHSNTKWKTFKHCCGAAEPFMKPFIESGFDIINPVQLSAVGMDAANLKKKYGDRLTFWGGAVDTQKTLPFGSPAEVRREVRERCEIFSKDGGFVFNSIHNVQARTPVENVVAMIETVRDFNEGR